VAVPGDEQHRRLEQLCQEAQDAALEARLVKQDGRPREVRRGGWGVCGEPIERQRYMQRKRRLKTGTLMDMQRVLWRTVGEVEALLDARPPSNELILRVAHALAQLANAYKSVVEVADIEPRLKALERASADRNGHGHQAER
jgi:hypothetical protein